MTLIPTIIGVLVYLGTVSLLGYLHDPIHVFMVAALMGVSNDDVLYLVVIMRERVAHLSFARALESTIHRTGVAIIQTTLVITAGVVVFFASDYLLLRRAGLVAIVGLWAATLATLTALPSVIKLMLRRQQPGAAGGDTTPAERIVEDVIDES
jgi:predicted RND superfamily exporter protein